MRLEYLQFGQKGQIMVFLHGWQQDGRSFLPLTPFLSQKYRLFYLDLPGFGKSSLPSLNYSSFDYAGVIINWLEKKKFKKIILIGHSFGGKVASIIAAQRPDLVSKLILIASAGIIHSKVINKLVPSLISNKIPLRLKNLFASRDYKQAGKLLPVFKRIVKEDLQPIFKQIKTPTLILWGQQDQELPVSDGQTIQKLIKKSRLVLLKGDHFPFWQDPRKVAKILNDFIQS